MSEESLGRLGRRGPEGQRARHTSIAEYVLRKGSVSIDDIVAHTGVSLMTVYRDVAALEEAGLVQRHRGQVSAVASGMHEASAAFRVEQQQLAKQAMAQALVERIRPGSSLMLDDSTSGVFVVRALAQTPQLTVVTNSLLVARETAHHNDVKLFIAGGEYQAWADSVLGPQTLRSLSQLDADYCVLSASGIAAGSCFHPYPDVVAVKQAMLTAARTKILLLDHTKLCRHALHQFARLDEFDAVIVDAQTTSADLARLRDWGARLEVADPLES